MHKMDDLWPGVAAVCLCPVCVTSAMGFGGVGGGTLLMFPLRHDEGKGTVEALLMLQRDGQITDRRRCTLQEQVPRVNTEIMMTRPPSPCCSLHLFQSPECKAASSDQLFFFSARVSVETFVPLCKALVSERQCFLFPFL